MTDLKTILTPGTLPPIAREESTVDCVNDEAHELPYDTVVPLMKGTYESWDEARVRMRELMRKRGLLPVQAFETATAYVFRCVKAAKIAT